MIASRIYLAFTFAVMLIVSTAAARAQSGEPEQPATQPASQGGGLLDVPEHHAASVSGNADGRGAGRP